MNQMNRFAAALRNRAGQFSAGALAFAAAPAAFAQSGGLASAVTAEVDTAELIAIGLIVMTVAGIVMFIRSGKKVAN